MQFVKGDWIKPGAVVIDCGINAVKDSSRKSGIKLEGDVDFTQAFEARLLFKKSIVFMDKYLYYCAL